MALNQGHQQTLHPIPVPMPPMPAALFVGNVVWDDVLELPAYPQEDSKAKASSRRGAVGGNAANSARVAAALLTLQQDAGQHGGNNAVLPPLGRVALAAAVGAPSDPITAAALSSLSSAGVDTSLCAPVSALDPSQHAVLSTSTILATPTSRTIVNHRCIPELSAAEVRDTPLWRAVTQSSWHVGGGVGDGETSPTTTSSTPPPALPSWVHFEARSVLDTLEMMRQVREARDGRLQSLLGQRSSSESSARTPSIATACPLPHISVELERERPGPHPVHLLLQHADVAVVSKDFFGQRLRAVATGQGEPAESGSGSSAAGGASSGTGTDQSSTDWSSMSDGALREGFQAWTDGLAQAAAEAEEAEGPEEAAAASAPAPSLALTRVPPLFIVPLGEAGAAAFLCQSRHTQGRDTAAGPCTLPVHVVGMVRIPAHAPGTGSWVQAGSGGGGSGTTSTNSSSKLPVVDTTGAGDTFNGALVTWAVAVKAGAGGAEEGRTAAVGALWQGLLTGRWDGPEAAPAVEGGGRGGADGTAQPAPAAAAVHAWLTYAAAVAGEKVGFKGLDLLKEAGVVAAMDIPLWQGVS